MAGNEGTCPGITHIEAMARGEPSPVEITAHVESCPSCLGLLHAVRDDSEFLGRVRSLAAARIGPEGAPRIPGYKTLGIVSSGAQGIVYRAVQESTSRTVAIKTLTAGETASPRQRIRAEREAEIAARLRHPNIVTVFESRTLPDGRIAVVMEYVDGVPLDSWTPPGATPEERQRELLKVFALVCAAIHHAHLNGVIHRDLKPDNILVTPAPDSCPVVLDFGIAKMGGGIHTTVTGEFAGTPAYASPEQASGRADDVDALTDVYSLGVILYRLLCGAMPYNLEGSIFQIAKTISSVEPIAPRTRVPTISADLEAVTLRAMRKDKQRRYQSAASLGRDIERYLAGAPVDARSGSGWYMLRKAVSLNRGRLAWAAAAVVLITGAAIAVLLSLASAAESSRREALQREQTRAEGVRARAVTELLREALPMSDPERPELRETIAIGLKRLYFRLESGAFADDPEVDQALRRLWGSIYTGLGSSKGAGLVEFAEVSLRSGLERLRREGGGQSAEIAATLHELAGVLLVRKRLPEAEQTCREALAIREKLAGSASAPATESRALLARILLSLGRGEEAVHEADAALSALHTLPDASSDLLIASMEALKARVLLDACNFDACDPTTREALRRRLHRLAPEDPELLGAISIATDLAEACPSCPMAALLGSVWDARAADLPPLVRQDVKRLALPDRGDYKHIEFTGRTAALGRLLRLQDALLGPDDPAHVVVLIAQMRAAESEKEPAIRAAAALRAAAILSQRFGPDDSSVLACLEESAVVLAFIGRAAESVELAKRICAIRDAVPANARDKLLVADARRHLAWYLSLAGRHAEAIDVYRRAVQEFTDAVGPDHHTVALAQSGLAMSLFESGATREADELSRHALEAARRLPTTAPDQLAHICFIRGHILCGTGKFADARPLLEEAWEPGFAFCDRTFEWQRILVADMVRVCEGMRDAGCAEVWKSRRGDRAADARTPAPMRDR